VLLTEEQDVSKRKNTHLNSDVEIKVTVDASDNFSIEQPQELNKYNKEKTHLKFI